MNRSSASPAQRGIPVLSQLSQALARVLTFLLRGYQRLLSPIFAVLGSRCRFEPSCSQYMIDAIALRGPVTGVALGLWRLLRCNPLNAGGYDPAPPQSRRARRLAVRGDE